MNYEIPVGKVAQLEAVVDAVNKRAVRLGVQGIEMIKGELFHIEVPCKDSLGDVVYDDKGKVVTRKVVYQTVSFKGEPPKLNGWTFVGVVTPVGAGSNLLTSVPGEMVPELYRSAALECDHCKTNRMRKETFVFHHEDGQYIQIGRRCTKDYFGRDDYARVAAMLADGYKEIRELVEGDDDIFRGGHSDMVHVSEILSVAALIIRKKGWISRARSQEKLITSTADLVCDYIWGDRSRELHKEVGWVQPEDEEMVQKTIEWAKSYAGGEQYNNNLKVICGAVYVPYKSLGLIVSAVAAYQREEEQKRRVENGAGWMGQPGDKVEVAVRVLSVREIGTNYGVSHRYMMEDAAGHSIIWWASNPILKVNPDVEIVIKGRIKGHDEYRGQRQTVLTRCSVVG